MWLTLIDQSEPVAHPYVTEVNDGATCIFQEGKDVPLICRKSDGGFNYASTDLAALWQRVNNEKCDWIIYVTDVGQSSHFEVRRCRLTSG